jgi:pimeloyl-ACP methyl ester carboxylesterase
VHIDIHLPGQAEVVVPIKPEFAVGSIDESGWAYVAELAAAAGANRRQLIKTGPMSAPRGESMVSIRSGRVLLEGILELPLNPSGVVAFSHGSGSGRHSPRNRYVARELQAAGLGTLLLDLLTPEEDQDYEVRFDIELLTGRLADAVRFLREHAATQALPVGLFGASTGAASALRVAAAMLGDIKAVVSRGGRPDLTGEEALPLVRAPTLLIVGGRDHGVIELNQAAYDRMRCVKEIKIVPGATHLFEEAGALEQVAGLAVDWFSRHLAGEDGRSAGK